jgi:SAM-dependent methyltransferase
VDDDALLEHWRRLFAEQATGWDFSRFAGRIVGDEPPWAYAALAHEALSEARSVLDVGTGGGEVLLSLASSLPTDTVATEGWAPNVPVARASLAPLGVEVVEYDAERDPRMPFPDARFEVVLDRHEAYDVREVARVLSSGGVFLTQQVDGRDLAELNELFDVPVAYSHVTLESFVADASTAGLEVDLARDWSGLMRVVDVDTLVAYLGMTPWTVEGFSVDRHADVLLGLHRGGAPVLLTQRRFVLRARKP